MPEPEALREKSGFAFTEPEAKPDRIQPDEDLEDTAHKKGGPE